MMCSKKTWGSQAASEGSFPSALWLSNHAERFPAHLAAPRLGEPLVPHVKWKSESCHPGPIQLL